MRSRIDLLRNMTSTGWVAVVAAVLSRPPEEWPAGRAKLKVEGIDWLRQRLIVEGLEVMSRYDQLLPVEPKK